MAEERSGTELVITTTALTGAAQALYGWTQHELHIYHYVTLPWNNSKTNAGCTKPQMQTVFRNMVYMGLLSALSDLPYTVRF